DVIRPSRLWRRLSSAFCKLFRVLCSYDGRDAKSKNPKIQKSKNPDASLRSQMAEKAEPCCDANEDVTSRKWS
ncbi:MAG: hypothetical protein KGY81_09425, partial [Phycisphaerae bacterium]|nr:hypothetical protein [Phycisphaerae bacterium]